MILTFFPNNMELEFVIRLVLTCVCGLLVGIERSRMQKAAGMRTYLIVAIGACVYAIVSKYGFLDVVGTTDVYVDVSRVCAGIVSGVGFLGAGTIFMRDDRIEGLSTSAGIWGIAAVGTGLGIGMYVPAVATTLLILGVQIALHSGNHSIFEKSGRGRIVIDIDDKMSSLRKIQDMMEERNIEILYTEMEVHKDHLITYRFRVNLPENLNIAETASQIYRETNAKSIDI
ncbi:MAG: MgtC/SapB family protein [Lachnospiraceae bacterium]|nr:MgtC/SapB family protein [Lachnospiraceae bacterium]